MKPRELGGLLRVASTEVFLWIDINRHGGIWLSIPKAMARDVINTAKEDGFDVIRAVYDEKEDAIYLGGEDECADEAEAVCPPDLEEDAVEGASEEEEDGLEEEEEEEDADEDIEEPNP